MKYLIPIIAIIIIALVTIVPSIPVSAADPKIQEAPLRIVQPGEQSPVVDGHGTGFKPSNKKLPHLNSLKAVKITRPEVQKFLTKKSNVGSSGSPVGTGGTATQIIEVESISGPVSLPLRFDWRETGKVTPVKNQGNCGSCYAFAAIADFESKILINSGISDNLSENSAKECTFGYTSCSGGNYEDDVNLFSQKGTVLESCDPYKDSDVPCKGDCQYQKTLLDWRIISESAIPATDVLKTYLMEYGPLYTTLFSEFTEFHSYNGTYTLYYPGINTVTHAVLIVGWDDSLVHEGGTGGWICKNSWGTAWGGTCGYGSERGYFTIAYGSASIGKHSSFLHSYQDYDASGTLLYYDDGGWIGALGETGGANQTLYGLAKFIPTVTTSITRVEFWTTDATTDIDIYIYDNFSGGTLSTLLASKLDISYENAGYHSVQLDAPLAVTAGNDINVKIKFTNATYGYPLVYDNNIPISDRTYASITGADGSWQEQGSLGKDVAIRVRTSVQVPSSPNLISPASGATVAGSSIPFTWGSSSGATMYWLAVNKVSDGSYIMSQNVGNATSYTVPGFPNDGTQYRWSVAAGNSAGWSPGAPSQTVTNGITVTAPSTPNLISPASGATVAGSSIPFTWGSSSGATMYWLAVNKVSDGSYIMSQNVGNATSYTVPGFPNDGTQYRWSVAAGNSAGWSPGAPSQTVTNGITVTAPSTPNLISPASGATVAGSSIPFTWGSSSGATMYWLAVNKVSDGSYIMSQNVGNATSYTVPGFPNDGTQYRWSVAAGNSAGWSPGAPSQTVTNGITVTAPSTPNLISPASGATVAGSSIPFSWGSSVGATMYWLAVNKVSDGSYITSQNVGNVTSYTVPGFPNDGTQYRWSVAAGNSAGWSPGAPSRTFTSGP